MENKMTVDESLGGSKASARQITHGGSNIRTNVGKQAVNVISGITARRKSRSLAEIMRSDEGVTQQEKQIRLGLPNTDRTNLAKVNTGVTGHRKERSLADIMRSTEVYISDDSLLVNPNNFLSSNERSKELKRRKLSSSEKFTEVVKPRRSNRTIRPTLKLGSLKLPLRLVRHRFDVDTDSLKIGVQESLEASMMNSAQILLELHEKIWQSQPIPNVRVESEPRRSNRKMRPTLKVLESWESAMILSEKTAASHNKHCRPKYKSTPKST